MHGYTKQGVGIMSTNKLINSHRRKRVTSLFAFGLAYMMILILLFPIKSFASGFDPVYYAERYPDVVAALGDSKQALLNHYLNFGIAEGRFENAEAEKAGIPLTTYVDVNIQAQTMTYIQDGVPILSSPCVTGDVSKNRSTPTGHYAVFGHVKGTYLTGPTWRNWVDYWMPFTRSGCGLHDATWRSRFGDEIYKGNGSHGCVNLPPDVAAQLFDLVGIGTIVIVH